MTMTGFYRLAPILLILQCWPWVYSLHCVIACVKEFKINSVETVRDASQEPNLKIAPYVKRKTIKSKTELNKHSVTIPQLQFQ